jgi:hypothetical protein
MRTMSTRKKRPARPAIQKRKSDIRISLTLQEACHLVSWKLEADRFSCLAELERFTDELDMLTELVHSGWDPMPGEGESPYDALQNLRVRMGFCVRLTKLLEKAGATP